jgi:FixJ family two-component response regulator
MSLSPESHEAPLICIIDDDAEVRGALDSLLRSTGFDVRTFGSPDDYLACDIAERASCLILDIHLGDANGLDFQQQLLDSEASVPIILMTGFGDIPQTVRAMKAGAVNFLSKPFDEEAMLAAVREAVARDEARREDAKVGDGIRSLYGDLTTREKEVMGLVTAGLMNKQVAAHLDLSEITVKIHRGHVMRKMHAQSLADLVRMAELLGVRETSATRYRNSA